MWGANLFSPDELKEVLSKLPVEERLKGLKIEERFIGLTAEERLKGLKPEERLAGLSLCEMEELEKKLKEAKQGNG